jgi:hypothetical protein
MAPPDAPRALPSFGDDQSRLPDQPVGLRRLELVGQLPVPGHGRADADLEEFGPPGPGQAAVGASQVPTSLGIGVWIDSSVSMRAWSGPSKRIRRASTFARSSSTIEADVLSNRSSISCKAGGAW